MVGPRFGTGVAAEVGDRRHDRGTVWTVEAGAVVGAMMRMAAGLGEWHSVGAGRGLSGALDRQAVGHAFE